MHQMFLLKNQTLNGFLFNGGIKIIPPNILTVAISTLKVYVDVISWSNFIEVKLIFNLLQLGTLKVQRTINLRAIQIMRVIEACHMP